MIELSNIGFVVLIIFTFILGALTWEYVKSQIK